MTVAPIAEPGAGIGRSGEVSLLTRAMSGKALPILIVVLAIVAIWYAGAVWLNWQTVADRLARSGTAPDMLTILKGTVASDRPILPAPHQVALDLWKTIVETRPTSPRSLLFHAWVTLSSTLLGFAIGTALGILLAVGILHSRTLDKSLMPWIITSQTIPILAIAPMIIVVLSSIGVTGLLPKAVISTYLSFFPVTVGMVKGLRSPDTMLIDLMHTYSASRGQVLAKLRLPASLPFLFASMKIAVAAALVGAIVGELPTGAQAGLGARLLAGSYYGQTVQIWSALVMASVLAGTLVALVGFAETAILKRTGAR
ncbi:ABC transporter permease [Aureimonas ureilytica]|uniref:ABC transporter permease n=1 Tax=Aureimonas ureilytica TaxID=401562 RepID=UPI003CF54E41